MDENVKERKIKADKNKKEEWKNRRKKRKK